MTTLTGGETIVAVRPLPDESSASRAAGLVEAVRRHRARSLLARRQSPDLARVQRPVVDLEVVDGGVQERVGVLRAPDPVVRRHPHVGRTSVMFGLVAAGAPLT